MSALESACELLPAPILHTAGPWPRKQKKAPQRRWDAWQAFPQRGAAAGWCAFLKWHPACYAPSFRPQSARKHSHARNRAPLPTPRPQGGMTLPSGTNPKTKTDHLLRAEFPCAFTAGFFNLAEKMS